MAYRLSEGNCTCQLHHKLWTDCTASAVTPDGTINVTCAVRKTEGNRVWHRAAYACSDPSEAARWTAL